MSPVCKRETVSVVCLLVALALNKHQVLAIKPQLCPAKAGTLFSYAGVSPDGPDHWGTKAQCCSGQWQSPINIVTKQSLCDQDHDIKYTDIPTGSSPGYLVNKGYALSMNFVTNRAPSLLGVPYRTKEAYALGNLHIHSAGSVAKGSEHYVDGAGYDAEIHLVHYMKKYGDIGKAMLHTDGLVVVGIFLQAHPKGISTNKEMERLISATLLAADKLDSKYWFELNIRALFPWRKDFYVYHGSLTTPPCSESVRWIVMRDPIYVTPESLNQLRSSRMTDGSTLAMHGNCRPLSPLNGRRVDTNFHC